MLICNNNSLWGIIFAYTSFIIFTFLLLFYFISIIHFLQNKDGNKIHKLDVFTITFSFLQICLFIISYLYDLYLVSLWQSLLKFTLNTVLCCLLLLIIMWKFEAWYSKLNNSIWILILAIDIFCVIIAGKHKKLTSLNKCNANPLRNILAFAGWLFDFSVICLSMYINFRQKIENNLNWMVKEDQFYVKHIFASFVRRVKYWYRSYLIIIVGFLVSNFTELLFALANYWEKSLNDNSCYSYGNNISEEDFNIEQYYLCFNGFMLRDVLPIALIYIPTLIFKWK